ncbi:MAG: hypothetical protein LQ337_006837 [Flavoplaca oasis]|nr:MAG: hypothetical protein LQ337_006837 [Flavoplaca oasis]
MAKRPEGQGYCHTLVIPKPRIYNVVDPLATRNDCSVLKELCEHFKNFWTSSGKIKRRLMLQRARRALDERDAELVSVPIRRPPEYTELVRKAVFADFERMQSDFLALNVEDFLFGFHVFPDNSIGHLHMHVFPHDSRFREHSTKTYDYKTVPLQAILDVEAEDASPANGVHVDKGVEASAHETVDLTRVASSNGEGSSNLDAASMLDTPSEREESEDPPIGAVQLNNGTSSPDTFISGFVPVNR